VDQIFRWCFSPPWQEDHALQQWSMAAWGSSRTGAFGRHGPRLGARNGAESGVQARLSRREQCRKYIVEKVICFTLKC
jgi:hypothetical protein